MHSPEDIFFVLRADPFFNLIGNKIENGTVVSLKMYPITLKLVSYYTAITNPHIRTHNSISVTIISKHADFHCSAMRWNSKNDNSDLIPPKNRLIT